MPLKYLPLNAAHYITTRFQGVIVCDTGGGHVGLPSANKLVIK